MAPIVLPNDLQALVGSVAAAGTPLTGVPGIQPTASANADLGALTGSAQAPTAPSGNGLTGAVAAAPAAPPSNGGGDDGDGIRKLGGLAGSFAHKMALAADKLGIDSSEPGGWARSLVGAAQSALAGVGAVGQVPPGAGGLYGVGKALQYQQAQAAAAKADAEKQAQQAKENAREDQRSADEHQQALYNAETHAMNIADQKLGLKIKNEQDLQNMAENGKILAAPYKDHHDQIGEAVTPDDIQANMGPGKKYDMTKVIPIQTGWKPVDKNGETIEVPTFDIYKRDARPVTVDKDAAALLQKYGAGDAQKVQEGQVLDGDIYYRYAIQAKAAATQADAEASARREANIKQINEENTIQNNADRVLTAPYTAAHPEDVISALKDLSTQKDPKTGQATPQAQAAQRQLQNYKPEEVETHRHNVAQEGIEREKNRLKQVELNQTAAVNSAGGTMTDSMKQQIAALPADQQKVLSSVPESSRGALLAVAFGPGDVDFHENFPVRLTKGAPGLNAQTATGIIRQLNPNWSEQQYKRTGDAYKQITTGELGTQIAQYNNVLQHGSEAQDVIENSWRQHNPEFLNRGLNYLEQHGNGTEVSKIQASLEPVKSEFEQLMAGGYKPSDAEQKSYDTLFNPAATPNQIEAALKVVGAVGAIRLENINQQYKRIAGQDIPGILTNDAADAAKHLNLDSDAQARLGRLNIGDTLFHRPDWKPPTPSQVQQQNQTAQAQQQARNAGAQLQAPPAASSEVYVGGKLVGHVVGNKYVPLGQ